MSEPITIYLAASKLGETLVFEHEDEFLPAHIWRRKLTLSRESNGEARVDVEVLDLPYIEGRRMRKGMALYEYPHTVPLAPTAREMGLMIAGDHLSRFPEDAALVDPTDGIQGETMVQVGASRIMPIVQKAFSNEEWPITTADISTALMLAVEETVILPCKTNTSPELAKVIGDVHTDLHTHFDQNGWPAIVLPFPAMANTAVRGDLGLTSFGAIAGYLQRRINILLGINIPVRLIGSACLSLQNGLLIIRMDRLLGLVCAAKEKKNELL